MAKKITPNELFCQDVETTAHDQPIAPFQNSANINLETTSSVSVVRYEEPQPTNDQFNEQYSGLTPYNVPQPLNTQYQPGFTYTNMLTCMNEANSALYGSYPGQDDNICRDPNCHVNCKSTIDALQRNIDEMQSKIQFLESQHMRGFLDKLAKKISSSDSFDVNSNTPRRPAKNIDVSKMENYTAPSSNSSISGLASPSHCGADTIRDISNSPLLHNSQMVELVAGSGVTISTSQLNMCERKAKESGTALARLLLVVFFDAKTLGESCARGSGSSKRKMLEPSITEAVIQYCLNFKQKKVTEKEIVQAINNKCSDVRQEFTKTPKSKKISL